MSEHFLTFKFFTVYELPIRPNRKTHDYVLRNNRSGVGLGTIEWYGPWRQYCFIPMAGTVWSADCLKDVATAIRRAMEARHA